jgi:4-amino-4-deoxy-L-arabinose transferase-like glycosyltransferase
MLTPHRLRAFKIGILSIHVILLLVLLRHTFVTVDEPGHVVAGLSYWRTGQFLVYRVNPPLTKLISAAPLLLTNVHTDFRDLSDNPMVRAEWAAGPMFVRDNHDRLFELVCLARLSGIAWSVLGALLIFNWSQALYGNAAGCLAMMLWCFEPNLLAHSVLVTADVPCAVMAIAASRAFWEFLKSPTWWRTAGVGVLLGLAILTKFTLLLFYALWPLVWVAITIRTWQRRVSGHPQESDGAAGSKHVNPWKMAAIILISVYVINVGYAFDGSFKALRNYTFISKVFSGSPDAGSKGAAGRPGNRFLGTILENVPVPLPSDVLKGIDVQRRDFESHWQSYLAGEWRDEGWYHYYVMALGLKLPIGAITLLLAGAMLTLARSRTDGRRSEEIFLLLNAFALIAFISSQTGFNHHMRYVLVALPFLMITAGRLATVESVAPRALRVMVLGLLTWSILSCLSVFPHLLSYFNEIAGGPEHGHDYLVDSNIDWGQDLLELKTWLNLHPEAKPLGFAYFNTVDPGIVGIDYTLPPKSLVGPESAILPDSEGPQPGYYAISVNFLRGIDFHAFDGKGGTTRITDRAYTYFRMFKPIARAGYSIYIYHITPQEADEARKTLGMSP